LPSSQNVAWYGLKDDRRTRIWVGIARDDKSISVLVIWPPRGIDSWVDKAGDALRYELKKWWKKWRKDYLDEHAQPPWTPDWTNAIAGSK
jgi:hypothetical protein